MADGRAVEATSGLDDLRNARRRSFRLRKWYFDFLTPGLDYGFVYFADVYLLGTTFRTLTVHLARHGKGVSVPKTLAVEHAGERSEGDGTFSFSFSRGQIKVSEGPSAIDAYGPGCSVHLHYRPVNVFRPQPVVIHNSGRSRILWRPVHLKSEVSGSVVVGSEIVDVKGCDGYVDYLESSYLPPAVPVRTLYWGRLHHPDLDLVFMRVANGSGNAAWSRLSFQAGDSVTDCEEVAIVKVQTPHGSPANTISPAGYHAAAACGSRRIHVKVRHAAAVQESRFIDHQLVKSAGARYILRKMTRDPRSTKWLSYADVVLEEGGVTKQFKDVPLIDEFALL